MTLTGVKILPSAFVSYILKWLNKETAEWSERVPPYPQEGEKKERKKKKAYLRYMTDKVNCLCEERWWVRWWVSIVCLQLLERKGREEITSSVVMYEMALQETEAPINTFLQGELFLLPFQMLDESQTHEWLKGTLIYYDNTKCAKHLGVSLFFEVTKQQLTVKW